MKYISVLENVEHQAWGQSGLYSQKLKSSGYTTFSDVWNNSTDLDLYVDFLMLLFWHSDPLPLRLLAADIATAAMQFAKTDEVEIISASIEAARAYAFNPTEDNYTARQSASSVLWVRLHRSSKNFALLAAISASEWNKAAISLLSLPEYAVKAGASKEEIISLFRKHFRGEEVEEKLSNYEHVC